MVSSVASARLTAARAAVPLRRHVITCALTALLACALAGCGQQASSASGDAAASTAASSAEASEAGAVTFTDDLGREVTVNNPQRVVVGMGSLADIWRDAGGSVVGLSDDAFDNFGFDRSQASGVGRHTDLNLEAIMALSPDLVILSGQSDGDSSNNGPSQQQLQTSLEQAGVPVAFFNVDTFDDYLRTLQTFTKITGRDDLYDQNGVQVQERVKQALSTYSVAGDHAPRVLVMNASSKGASAQDPTHMASVMVKDLGATLLTEENPSVLSDFSMEAVAELNPDYIFVLPAATSDDAAQKNYDAVASNPAWQQIPAVRDGHVAVLDIEHFFRKPNAEWDVAYATLGEALKSLQP